MAEDDDRDCPGHLWRLTGVALLPGAGATEYECALCGASLYVAGDDVMPDTV